MKMQRALAWARCELVSLFLEFAVAIAALAILAIAAPIILIFAAQLDRLATKGNWRGFAFSEFLDVLGVAPSALADESRQSTAFILTLPAALVLSLAALILCLVAYGLFRLIRRERTRLVRMQQHALIEDIERKLETPQSPARKPESTGA